MGIGELLKTIFGQSPLWLVPFIALAMFLKAPLQKRIDGVVDRYATPETVFQLACFLLLIHIAAALVAAAHWYFATDFPPPNWPPTAQENLLVSRRTFGFMIDITSPVIILTYSVALNLMKFRVGRTVLLASACGVIASYVFVVAAAVHNSKLATQQTAPPLSIEAFGWWYSVASFHAFGFALLFAALSVLVNLFWRMAGELGRLE